MLMQYLPILVQYCVWHSPFHRVYQLHQLDLRDLADPKHKKNKDTNKVKAEALHAL